MKMREGWAASISLTSTSKLSKASLSEAAKLVSEK